MLPPSPTERFSQLAIDSMPPTTRSRTRIQDPEDSPASESDHDSDELGYNDDDSFTFPSKLSYNLSELDEATRDHVAEIMYNNPPKCFLQECKAREQFIVFQVAELVERSVRVVSPGFSPESETEDEDQDEDEDRDGDEDRNTLRSCDCEEHAKTRRPCRHMLWLFDQITNQLEPARRKSPLTLTMEGYPSELGNLYDRINEFHLDMMAEALHSQVPDTNTGDDNRINPRRVQAIREMLASVNAVPAEGYRPDLFTSPTKGRRIIKTRDLEGTVFRMLLRNDSFFQYFRDSLKYDELFRSPLTKLQWRMETAIAKFDTFRLAPNRPSHGRIKDAEWCARHLSDVDGQIRSIILNADPVLSDGEFHEIAILLIRMFQEVINRNEDVMPLDTQVRTKRNLYYALLGNKDLDFITGTFDAIPPEHLSHFNADIDNIIDTLGQLAYAVPGTYLKKLRRISARARNPSTRSRSGSKRPSGGGQDSRAKRMK